MKELTKEEIDGMERLLPDVQKLYAAMVELEGLGPLKPITNALKILSETAGNLIFTLRAREQELEEARKEVKRLTLDRDQFRYAQDLLAHQLTESQKEVERLTSQRDESDAVRNSQDEQIDRLTSQRDAMEKELVTLCNWILGEKWEGVTFATILAIARKNKESHSGVGSVLSFGKE